MRRLLVLPAVLSCLALGACGDADEKNAYVSEVNAAQTAFAEAVGNIPSGASADPGKAIGQVRKELGEVIDDLRGVDPPESAEKAHGKLVAALEGFRKELGTLTRRLRSGDPATLANAAVRLASAAQRYQRQISDTIDELNRALKG